MAERARAVPAWGWLGAIVLGSFLVRAWLSRDMPAPFVMTDELTYAELARSFAATGSFAIRDVATSGYGVLYPLLVAPAYALFDSLPDAYGAVKAINALVMSLAAVPAYLIARRVASQGLALLATLLAVAIPSLVYTGTVMTENLYYPLVLFAAWACLLVLADPSWRRVLLLLLTLALAAGTRSQAVALVAAAASAPLVLALLDGRRGPGLRFYWRLYASLGAAAAVVVMAQLVRTGSLGDLLGAYRVVGDRSYDLAGILRYWLWHVEELTLLLGVVPVAALILLLAQARSLTPALRQHLAVTVGFVVWTTLVVAVFASEFALRIQERNVFTVAPLLLTCLVAWVAIGSPRPFPVAILATGLAVLLVVVFPYTRFIDESAKSDTLAILPIWSAYGSLLFDSIILSVLAGALALAALFLLVPARFAVLVPIAVLAWFCIVSKSVWSGPRGFVQAGAGALYQGIRGQPRDWIDTALPDGATAGIVWTGLTDRFTVNQNEFFNRALGPVYHTTGPTPGNLPETPVRVDPADGVLRRADGSPVTDRYLVTDASLELDGHAIARDVPLGLTLWRVAGPVARRAEVTITGLYPNDTWSGPRVEYERRRCSEGVLEVPLHSDASLFSVPQTVIASADGRALGQVRLQAPEPAVLRVPLVPGEDGGCRVRFDVSPTAVPGGGDERRLGVHFDAFNFEAR